MATQHRTISGANRYFYGDARYGNYNEEKYFFYGWLYIQLTKLLKIIDG